MGNQSETREYDLVAIVENQTPEQREATANRIVDTIREKAFELLQGSRYHDAIRHAHSPVLVLGKSRLTRAIKQAIT